MADDGLHGMMVYWVKREREVRKKKDVAFEDAKKWFKRAKLAADRGETEMAAEAKQNVRNAKLRFEQAELLLEEIEREKEELRRDKERGTGIELKRANHLLNQFKEMGIDGRFEALNDPSASSEPIKSPETMSALDRLRARMGDEE